MRAKRVIEGESSGFNDELTNALNFDGDMNSNFDMFDIRQSGGEWVNSSIKKFLNVLFSYRKKMEPKMNDQMLNNLDQQIDQLLDMRTLKQHVLEMLNKEKSALETQRNIILRKPELEFEQTIFANNNVNIYDNIRKSVTNEGAWRRLTLKLVQFQWKYPDMEYAQQRRSKSFYADVLTLQRLREESMMPEGKTYPEYERKMRIEAEDARTKDGSRIRNDIEKRKMEKENKLSLLTNDAIFALAESKEDMVDGEDSGTSFLERGIQGGLNEFRSRSELYQKHSS